MHDVGIESVAAKRSSLAAFLDEQAARRLLCPFPRRRRRSVLCWPRHIPLSVAPRMSHVVDVAELRASEALRQLVDPARASIQPVALPRE